MKTIFLSGLFALSAGLSFGQNKEFYQFKEREVIVSESLGIPPLKRNDTIEVSEFEMSSFITWKQYKLFLVDVERMLGQEEYSSLQPKLPTDYLNACLTTTKFDKSPVTGVSWSNANEYCKWRMVVDNAEFGDNGMLTIVYRLPYLDEWISAYLQLEEKGKKHDLNKTYADWTLNALDESMYFGLDYSYDAMPDDPPSMKRKMVIGANFSYSFPEFKDYATSFYQDSSYAHIGFRLIRSVEDETEYLDGIDHYLGDHFEEFWNDEEPDGIKKTVIVEGISINYYEVDGQLLGLYESHYPNGVQKSKGWYYKNQRVGTWEIWDSLGVKQIERNYVSPYRFTQSFPKLKDEQAIILRDSRMVEFHRNEAGFIAYPFVQERSVLWSQRYWSRIESPDNLQLFRNNRLAHALSEAVKNGSLKPFDTNSDQFIDSISREEFLKRNTGIVTVFELKSDVFYDLDRAIMSTRIIGICPIIVDTVDGIAFERKLAWLYFPQVRSVLNEIHCYSEWELYLYHRRNGLKSKQGSSPQTLDDLFFFRSFVETIQGVSSYKGRTTFTPEESESTGILHIEQEHDLWLHLNSTN